MPLKPLPRLSVPSFLALGAVALAGALLHQGTDAARTITNYAAPAVTMDIVPISVVQDGNKLVKVRAVSEMTHLVPGETNWIGLGFTVSRDWHIYWRNPGTGMPTSWELENAPAGITLGDAVWPTPERYETQFGIDFVYHGRAFVMIPVEVSQDVAKLDEVTLEIKANWLVCKEICVPGQGTAVLTLPVAKDGAKAEKDSAARAFERARKEAPQVVEDLEKAGIEATVGRALTITKKGATEMTFFPYENEDNVLPNEGKDDLAKKGDTLVIRYPGNDLAVVEEIRGVLVTKENNEEKRYELTIPVR